MEVWGSSTSQVKRKNVQRFTVNPPPRLPEPGAMTFPSASTLKKLWEHSHNLGKEKSPLAPLLIIYLLITLLDVHLHPKWYYPGKHLEEELILEPVWHLMPENVWRDLKNCRKMWPHCSNRHEERHEPVQKQHILASFYRYGSAKLTQMHNMMRNTMYSKSAAAAGVALPASVSPPDGEACFSLCIWDAESGIQFQCCWMCVGALGHPPMMRLACSQKVLQNRCCRHVASLIIWFPHIYSREAKLDVCTGLMCSPANEYMSIVLIAAEIVLSRQLTEEQLLHNSLGELISLS